MQIYKVSVKKQRQDLTYAIIHIIKSNTIYTMLL